ncbi:unnamed protein product [Chondrus crispus]|uniref:peptidylprolyl isomerase n=1 Tax=Chondrus crispus TaxID=2769 RepID=R7QHV0_CHOCR|nr:unnamed protein product [Chondrus crispus]CDF37031.1 unnamed protein product [Chondrus crispus]|eukprot:XP_005716850.1 unnamed protein product [Chondrus crispus]
MLRRSYGGILSQGSLQLSYAQPAQPRVHQTRSKQPLRNQPSQLYLILRNFLYPPQVESCSTPGETDCPAWWRRSPSDEMSQNIFSKTPDAWQPLAGRGSERSFAISRTLSIAPDRIKTSQTQNKCSRSKTSSLSIHFAQVCGSVSETLCAAMEGAAAFASSVALCSARVVNPGLRSSCPPSMNSAPTFSRRQVSRLALGALLATTVLEPTGRALAAARRPEYIKDESGISYYDVKGGSGAGPINGDFVVIDYQAFLSNGKIFDNRKGFVFQMGQRQVIPGLETAVSTMKPGGERKVVIPPTLAYGDRGVCIGESKECLVPPGETLGYSVNLQRVAISPT